MKQKLLTQLLHDSVDADYVEHFQALAAVNLEIQKRGPTAPRLIRKAILEAGAGNYVAGREAAEDALVLEPGNIEAHYQFGVANLLMALVRSGVTAGGPGMQRMPDDTLGSLVESAVEAMRIVLEDNPEDREASEDLAFLTALQEESESDQELGEALRDAMQD